MFNPKRQYLHYLTSYHAVNYIVWVIESCAYAVHMYRRNKYFILVIVQCCKNPKRTKAVTKVLSKLQNFSVLL